MSEHAHAQAEAHAPGILAHHFDDLEQQRSAATLGMWTFLATEVMFFGGLIAGFLVYRFTSPEAFALGSHELNVMLGSLNTWVLLTSSLTMALAVRAGQTGDKTWQVRYLLITMVLGVAFLGIKGTEYVEEIHKHLVPGPSWNDLGRITFPTDAPERLAQRTQMFFVFYFFMTALHAFHMVGGLGVVGVIAYKAHRGHYGPEYHTPLELTGLYWHFVDIVWVFLYPLLYLIDLHK